MLHNIGLVLETPDIAKNTGAILRSCACFAAEAHLIEPLGFIMSDKRLQRSGMDYLNHVQIRRHSSVEDFDRYRKTHGRRVVLIETGYPASIYDGGIASGDLLVLGSESRGASVKMREISTLQLSIPMSGEVRSLNISAAAAIVLSESFRQNRAKSG